MPDHTPPEDAATAFDRSRELLDQAVAALTDPAAAALTHSELEDQVLTRTRELGRALLQDHLDLRATRETRREHVIDAEGVDHTRAEPDHRRQLATVVGTVAVTRTAYRAPGTPNLHPADAELNLPEGRHSHGLNRLTAIEATRGSFEATATAVERATGVKIGKRQVEQLTTAAATDVADFYARIERPTRPEDHLLMLTADARGIVMRPEALRPATARAAANAEHKLATRLSAGEKHGRKRMAELGCVYDAAPAARTPADIITKPGKPAGERAAGPKAQAKWLTGSVADDTGTVVGAVFDEAERRDPGHDRPWSALVDGNNTQIEAFRTEAEQRGVDLPILIDFIHVVEYLWKAAWVFFDKGDPAAEAWVADKALKILDGKAAAVATGIRRRATREGCTGTERTNADTAADYLTNKKDHLDYPAALAAGRPIATGVIEGACRHLIKDRMDITGARWGLAGAEAVLTLRAMVANGDFDDYWAFHLRRERERVHDARYHDTHVLAA